MFKYRVILVLVVLALALSASSANDNRGQTVDLAFVNPLEIGVHEVTSAAVGDGTYRLETEVYGQTAHLDMRFWNLVPRKNYVLWCITMPTTGQTPLYSAPCSSFNGVEITVRSDANGSAELTTIIPALQSSNENRVSMIALAYDLEGYTYGAPRTEIAVKTYIEFLAVVQ